MSLTKKELRKTVKRITKNYFGVESLDASPKRVVKAFQRLGYEVQGVWNLTTPNVYGAPRVYVVSLERAFCAFDVFAASPKSEKTHIIRS